MIGLGTNVLVRYLVQDYAGQAEAAGRLIEGRCTRESPGLVSAVVLAELAWVLKGAYGQDKAIVVSVLRQILQTAELLVDDPEVVWAALSDFEQGGADFADCLIAHGNFATGCAATYTFDEAAAAGLHFELLQ
mgnify:FL=1